jgi:nitrite reductase/ring-hydroxylating ferredoxin subunit
MTSRRRDIGFESGAYGYQPGVADRLLTEVGPGTPCGEFMRRYWQPVLASKNVTSRPQEVRILGEDLIVFRDRSGRPGLLYPRCMHRGTSLLWGHVEATGIRCCYHGWLFDVEGNCLEQPCEPNKGLNLAAARQPWYPLRERYGLVWTYMGPPGKRPILPRWDVLEDLEDGEQYVVNDSSYGAHRDNSMAVVPYSWLHMNDNIMDPFHVQVLHSTFSVYHFAREFEIMPTVEFEAIESGVIYKAYRKLDDGREVERTSTALLPNIMSVPSIELAPGRSNNVGFVVPVDDSHCRIIMVIRVPGEIADSLFDPAIFNGKSWSQMSLEERQDIPGDYEAQAGQGPISLHSEEHLTSSDRGVIMLRRLLKQQINIVREGGDPAGAVFDPAFERIRVPSGNFYR